MTDIIGRIRKYRDHAEQCRVEADLALHEAAKEAFMRMAEQWEMLAKETQQIERMEIFVQSAERACGSPIEFATAGPKIAQR
jgi:hypothetical protein